MKFEDLTPEQQERAKACKTPEEVFALAKEVGYEMTEEEIEAVSGGKADWHICWDKKVPCPNYCVVF